MRNQIKYFPLLLIIVLCGSACRKPVLDDNVKLRFSTSSITFDTVFTTLGSTTRYFTVYNPSEHDIKVDVFLAGGNTSCYSINVNGVAGNQQRDVLIPAKDSIFVFAKVTINPGNQNQPFLICDSIIFKNSRIEQQVQLTAYGQDAHFIVANSSGLAIVAHEHENITWTNDKPYVVMGGWAVVDSLGTLNIDPGTRIYFHKGSGLLVWRYGNIHVNGTREQPVIFRGDRLEPQYETDYNQWDRIWILEGNQENTIDYAIITNSYVGLQIEPWGGFNDITVTLNRNVITNTIIKNTYNSGILSRYSNIEVTNCVIGNNGSCSLQLEAGEYDFKHVTVGNYFSTTPARQNPALYLSNTTDLYQIPMETHASFVNCIVYGNLSSNEEIAIGENSQVPFSYSFENCLIKSSLQNDHFIDCESRDPEFVRPSANDYHIGVLSYAINRGKSNIGVYYDLDGNPRVTIPDIGAYEYMR
ncbi:MAG: hypothetical protein IKO62_05185 [Bacteroidales bacterium]|nr:hypothetical protein [Bacteroidales bacterium]